MNTNEIIADYCHKHSHDCTTHWHDGNYTTTPNDMLGAERVLTDEQRSAYIAELDYRRRGTPPSVLERAEIFVRVIEAIPRVPDKHSPYDSGVTERPPRTTMACEGCGCYSSTRMCWNCSTNPLQFKLLELENEVLRLTKAYTDRTRAFEQVEQMLGRLPHETVWDAIRRLQSDQHTLIDALLPLRLIYAEEPTASAGPYFEGAILTKQQVRDMQAAINRVAKNPIKLI